MKKTILKYIILSLLNTRDKGKNIKNNQRKKIHFLQRSNDKILLTETMETK